jgi:hypothetical protein
MSWIVVLATINVSAQVALPGWVRGRGLSIYGTLMFGALTLGSAVWGEVAALSGIPPRRLSLRRLGRSRRSPCCGAGSSTSGQNFTLRRPFIGPTIVFQKIEIPGPGNGAARILCSHLTNKGAGMASQYQIERERGTKESRQQRAVLREKWPLAFPVKDQDVRPLAIGAAGEIAAVMGWSLPYTLGVLVGWKMAPVYCQAVLCHDQRVALDGLPAEMIDAEAKSLAARQLAQLAARKAVKTAAKAAAPAMVKPKPAPSPPLVAPPEKQLRDRVRASLLRQST